MEIKPAEKLSRSEVTPNGENKQVNQTFQTSQDGNLNDRDAEVWQAYLAVEQKWEEVFRRLANS